MQRKASSNSLPQYSSSTSLRASPVYGVISSNKTSTSTLLPDYTSNDNLSSECKSKDKQTNQSSRSVKNKKLALYGSFGGIAILVLATLLYFLLPRECTFEVMSLIGNGPQNIIDQNSWSANVTLNMEIRNENYRSLFYDTLDMQLEYPFYNGVLGRARISNIEIAARSSHFLSSPILIQYTLQEDTGPPHGAAGFDIALSCGYLGATFNKQFFFSIKLVGSSGGNAQPLKLLNNNGLLRDNCPFAVTALPANLDNILPANIKTLTGLAGTIGGSVGGAGGVIGGIGDKMGGIKDTVDDIGNTIGGIGDTLGGIFGGR